MEAPKCKKDLAELSEEDWEYIEESKGKEVMIYYNNEVGCWLYSVACVDNPDVWLDSFDTMEEAVDFTARNDLILKETFD